MHTINERHHKNYLLFLVQYRLTEIVQRIFKYSDIQYSSLTLDKKLHSLVYTLCLKKSSHL